MSTGAVPAKMTLKPSRLKWAVVLLGCAAFVGIGIFIKPDTDQDAMMRWLVIGFFGLGVFASIPGLLGMGGLDLDKEGFTIRTIGKSSRRTWRECSEFSLVRLPRGGTFVGFSSATDEKHALAGMARDMVGTTGMLPDKYGMKAQALADLMNAFRARAPNLTA